MQARYEVSSWPIRVLIFAVLLTGAVLIGLAAVNYTIHGGSGMPTGHGSTQVQQYAQPPAGTTATRASGDAQTTVVEQFPDGLGAGSECKRFGGPRC